MEKVAKIDNYKKRIAGYKRLFTGIVNAFIKTNAEEEKTIIFCNGEIKEIASLFPDEIAFEVEDLLKKHVKKCINKHKIKQSVL